MRLIDANALIREECGSCDGHCNTFDGEECMKCTSHNKCQLREAIDDAPTVDAEPVRHGEWMTDDLGRTYCSECHKRLPYFHCYNDEPNSDWDEEWDEEIPETSYCPNCGAKMG